MKRKLGADTAMVQTQSPADFEDAFRDFAQRGFTIIFAHGFEYTDTALKVAKLFPKTWFIVTSGSGSSVQRRFDHISNRRRRIRRGCDCRLDDKIGRGRRDRRNQDSVDRHHI